MEELNSVLVFDGDSISLGAGASNGYTLADQVMPLLPSNVNCHVTAAYGRPVKDCLDLFETVVKPLYNPNAVHNVIFFHAGDNDIAWGRNAIETYDAMQNYIMLAHRQGWLVVVSTELQRYDWPEPGRLAIDTLNELILANSAGADGIADFQGNIIMGSESGRLDQLYYTSDHIHPADAGYTILAEIAAASLRPNFKLDDPA